MNAVHKAERERERERGKTGSPFLRKMLPYGDSHAALNISKNLACQEPREHRDAACHFTKERKTYKSLSYIHEMRLTTCRSVYNALRVNIFCNLPVQLGMIDTLYNIYTLQLECWNPKFAVGAYSMC